MRLRFVFYQIINDLNTFIWLTVAVHVFASRLGQCHHFVGCTKADQWLGQCDNLLTRNIVNIIRELIQFLGGYRKWVGALINKRLFSNFNQKKE